MLPVQLINGKGLPYPVKVNKEGAIAVTVVEQPAVDLEPETITRRKQYLDYLTNGGSNDLTVDGSVTPVKFTVGSEAGVVKWITGVRVVIHGTGFELDTNDFRKFGSSHTSGLTNGINLYMTQDGITTYFFKDPVKFAGDFMKYRYPADNWINFVNAISAQSDYLDVGINFVVPMTIPESSQDEITLEVRDNLQSLDLFEVLVYGYREIL